MPDPIPCPARCGAAMLPGQDLCVSCLDRLPDHLVVALRSSQHDRHLTIVNTAVHWLLANPADPAEQIAEFVDAVAEIVERYLRAGHSRPSAQVILAEITTPTTEDLEVGLEPPTRPEDTMRVQAVVGDGSSVVVAGRFPLRAVPAV